MLIINVNGCSVNYETPQRPANVEPYATYISPKDHRTKEHAEEGSWLWCNSLGNRLYECTLWREKGYVEFVRHFIGPNDTNLRLDTTVIEKYKNNTIYFEGGHQLSRVTN